MDFEPPPPKQNLARERADFSESRCRISRKRMGGALRRPCLRSFRTALFYIGATLRFCSNLLYQKFLIFATKRMKEAPPRSTSADTSKNVPGFFWFARDRFFFLGGQDIFSVFCPQGLGQGFRRTIPNICLVHSITFSAFLPKETSPSAFASDISARATRAYLSWCGLVFSERLRWKEMSRSGKTPATIWGEEGFPLPSVGLLLAVVILSLKTLN